MRDRYDPLPDAPSVARTVRVDGGFLPRGHLLPKPEWLEPTTEDVSEAARSGRRPGISVWDREVASHEDSCWWREVNASEHLSFIAVVGVLKDTAAKHARSLDAVADPLSTSGVTRLDHEEETRRTELVRAAEGHSLIEGIKREAGTEKLQHRSFREELARQFAKAPT